MGLAPCGSRLDSAMKVSRVRPHLLSLPLPVLLPIKAGIGLGLNRKALERFRTR